MGNQHPNLGNQKRKARLLSHPGAIRSTTQFASLEVKKGPFIRIIYLQWNKAADLERMSLDPLNTEGFCKGNHTTSPVKYIHWKEADSSVHSAFTKYLLPHQALLEIRHQCPREFPLVRSIGFQSHPCQTDRRSKVSKNQNNVFLHLLDYSTITGPTRGFKIMKPITSITTEA